MSKQNKLILVDGSGYIFRAYYALPPMSREDGTPVNAVFGFTNMLVKLIEDNGKEKLIVVDGLSNFIVVDDNDVLLILPREREQNVKKFLTEIKQNDFSNYNNHNSC